MFRQAIANVLKNCTMTERNSLRSFLVNCILNQSNGKQWLKLVQTIDIYSVAEQSDLERQIEDEELPLPILASLNEWKFNSKCKP